MTPSAPVTTRLAYVRAHGSDAVSFQALESEMHWWHDEAPPHGTGAAVAYVDTSRAWIAVGTPLAAPDARHAAAARFARAARARGRRAVFFGVEDLAPFDAFKRLRLGLQSVLHPAAWPATLRHHAKLREQVRRARAKHVVARVVSPDELAPGTALRDAVERLGRAWLGTRALEPMGFLVAVEPFHASAEHVYLVAERDGRLVHFLSAVPIYGRGGFLMEDVFRDRTAPNGTTELVIDALMRHVEGTTAVWLTPGLTPLAGPVAPWLRAAAFVMRPLYDFDGLRRFRARLAPARWDDVWLTWDRGLAVFVMLDVLRAFARGRLAAFAWRSLVHHPHGPPWVVAVPLVIWTALLASVTMADHAGVFGFNRAALAGWTAFDAGLAWLLFRTARRPSLRQLTFSTAAAAGDAVVSIWHLAAVGAGSSVVSAVLRLLATMGPIGGTAALAWAIHVLRKQTRAPVS